MCYLIRFKGDECAVKQRVTSDPPPTGTCTFSPFDVTSTFGLGTELDALLIMWVLVRMPTFEFHHLAL